MEEFMFEIHVTVKNDIPLDHYRRVCSDINVKPLVLSMNGVLDLMTSSKIDGEENAFAQMNFIVEHLTKYGMDVVRQKIETVPWHKNASEYVDNQNIRGYFETHIDISEEDLGAVIDLGFPVSKNEDKTQWIATYRSNVNYEQYKKELDTIKFLFDSLGIVYEMDHIEYALFDDNIEHDGLWFGLKNNT